MVCAFNSRVQEAEAGRSLGWRPAWSTERERERERERQDYTEKPCLGKLGEKIRKKDRKMKKKKRKKKKKKKKRERRKDKDKNFN